MVQYVKHGFTFSDTQRKNIRDAAVAKQGVLLRLRLDQLNGKDEVYITPQQLKRIQKKIAEKKGTEITLSKAQLDYERKHGGFLGALLGLLGPALATGAATSAGSWLFDKVIGKKGSSIIPPDMGKGIILPGTNTGGCCPKAIDPRLCKCKQGGLLLPNEVIGAQMLQNQLHRWPTAPEGAIAILPPDMKAILKKKVGARVRPPTDLGRGLFLPGAPIPKNTGTLPPL